MKPITILRIEREELLAILNAAKIQLKKWAEETDDATIKEYWLKHIWQINKINQYMTDCYEQTYYLYENIFRFQ